MRSLLSGSRGALLLGAMRGHRAAWCLAAPPCPTGPTCRGTSEKLSLPGRGRASGEPQDKRQKQADCMSDDPEDARARRLEARQTQRREVDEAEAPGGDKEVREWASRGAGGARPAALARAEEGPKKKATRRRFNWTPAHDDAILRSIVRYKVKNPFAPILIAELQGKPGEGDDLVEPPSTPLAVLSDSLPLCFRTTNTD